MTESRLPSLGRIVGWVLLALVIFVSTATFRLYLDGQRHTQEAMRLLNGGDLKTALAELEDAAKAYVPGSPYPERALRELAILAKSAEMRGDTVLAANIWEAARRSILATRHFFQPHEAQLANAEKEIVHLRTEKGSDSALKAKMVTRPGDPPFFASLFLFAGLVIWALGAMVLCSGGLDAGLRGVAWAVSLGGLGLWIIMAYWVG